jgi:hypothetical protein
MGAQDKPFDQDEPEEILPVAVPNWPWAVVNLGTTALWLAFAGWVAWLVLR